MILCDVNVLVYAFREDVRDHERYADWLNGIVASSEAYGVASIVLSGFLRVVTHPRIMRVPAPLDRALAFVRALGEQPNAVWMDPGSRHWAIFEDLCRATSARGNLVPDAYIAALAIEHGAQLATTDGDFARFPRLRHRHPLR
ncbi:MAG: type II toxin-antitoxin system VapC family toxin [Solirubrobacteraceae bacterium]